MRSTPDRTALWSLVWFFAGTTMSFGIGLAHALDADATLAAALRAKYAALQAAPGHNPFQKPLYLNSADTPSSVTGDIHALVNAPFAAASAALNSPGTWCDIMMLHVNTKYCRASMANQQDVLSVSIGRKYDQPVNDAYPVVFSYRVVAQTANYLRVQLNAVDGPLSTRDYRIVLEAIPMANEQTLVHLSYSFGYGMAGRLAMQVYLGTIGGNKVGFTIVDRQVSGQPLYVSGMRGLVERNTMRYFLAIEAYLGTLSIPLSARREKSLRDWYAGIERYPRQLHEMEENQYLDMKRKEFLRLQDGKLRGVHG